MLIKTSEGSTRDVEILESMLARPGLTGPTRTRIEHEIRTIRAGAKGEAEAAYEIDFHHGSSRNWAVIHNLRLEWQGRVAQIDHLLISRWLDIWVCESKHFSEGVAINEHGEFTAFFGGKPYGIASPIEQNRKHVAVLQAVLNSSVVQLPSRLGMSLRPRLRSVILVSKGARINRPKMAVDGVDTVIKTDTLRTLIEQDIDKESVASTLLSATKVVSSETLESLATQLARLHRPIQFNWQGKFGLDAPHASAPATKPATVVLATPDQTPSNKLTTSKLAAKLGIKGTAQMLEKLVAAGYLDGSGEQHALTPRGLACGAEFIARSRFGAYFLWPADLSL